MPPRRGASGTVTTPIIDIGFVGIQMQADPGIANMVENIRHMRERAISNVYLAMRDLSVHMEREAQDLARRKYRSHPERHGTERYPNEDVAADSITADAYREGDDVGVRIQYPPETVMMTKRGKRVTYGGILEANYRGDYEVINPIWEESYERIGTILSGALNRYGDEPRRSGSRKAR